MVESDDRDREYLRLLFVSRSLPFHHLGGMEAVAWDLARSLAKCGHEVEILTTQCPALETFSEREGVRIRTIDARSGRYSPTFWRSTAALFDSDYKDRVDAVLGIGMGAHAIARKRRPGEGPTLIMQSHGQPWGEFISKLAVPKPLSWAKALKNVLELTREKTLRRYDKIVAVGPAVEEILRAAPTRWALGQTPVQVISNGIDEGHFSFNSTARARIRADLGIGSDATVLISACRLHLQKGLHESLNGFACAYRLDTRLRYIISGSGPAESALRGQVARQGLTEVVKFTGAVDREILPQYLSAADVFMFTSKRREGLALGPLEAAAVGLPSVLSAHLEIAGLKTELVDPNNPEQIAAAIRESVLMCSPHRKSLLPFVYSLNNTRKEYEFALRSRKK